MINGKHCSNMELVAQGAGNIASALFGGIPATGCNWQELLPTSKTEAVPRLQEWYTPLRLSSFLWF